jgi:hypothetical protein
MDCWRAILARGGGMIPSGSSASITPGTYRTGGQKG